MKRVLLLIVALVSVAAVAYGAAKQIYYIDIAPDNSDDCKYHSWIGINVTVRTENDTIHHREHAPCDYTLRRRFEENGVECEIESGMCTDYSFYGSRGEIKVECRAGRDGYLRTETAEIECPEN